MLVWRMIATLVTHSDDITQKIAWWYLSSVSVGMVHPSRVDVLTCFSPCIVGSDLCVRFWSLRVGSLLRTIEPAEYAVSPASHAEPVLTEYASPPTSSILPIVCYSDTLGGCKGFPGCLIANGLEMSVFRL